MLDYNILSQKPTVTSVKDGKLVTYKDLTTQVYTGQFDKIGRMAIVEKYYVARPDLISLAMYGDDKYGDIICKINGISNPFELNEGMILFIPSSEEISKLFLGTAIKSDILDEYKTIKKNVFNIYSSNYTGEKNMEETIEKKKDNLQKYKNERRSPAEQTIMDNNYVIDRSLGLIIY